MNPPQSTARNRFVSLAVFGFLWCFLAKHLSIYWGADPQYSFGWLALAIVPYLAFLRWTCRPGPETGNSPLARGLFYAAAIAIFPTWLVEQPNPDWRLVSWALALEVVVVLLCAVYFAGGKRWLLHFGVCVCFILTTVPWPYDVEISITQGLMRIVTAVTVEILNLVGITALQHGNVIEVGTGMLGVDEACSGVRSLQATVMVSLFLGELYRGSWRKRLLLLLFGVLVAFVCNVCRAFLLSWVGATKGIDAVSEWHDPAGFTILTVCFFIQWGIAAVFFEKNPQAFQKPDPTPSHALPRGLAAGFAIWLTLVLTGTEMWYRAHEGGKIITWDFAWPETKPQFTKVSIPKKAAEMLKYNDGRGASWTGSDGSQWSVFFLKWSAGPVRTRLLARSSHRPEVCLPSAGYVLKQDRGIVDVAAQNLSIPFRALEFDEEGRQAHVFYCVWEDSTSNAQSVRNSWNSSIVRTAAIQSVLQGERTRSEQVLEVVVTGVPPGRDLDEMFRQEIAPQIRAQ